MIATRQREKVGVEKVFFVYLVDKNILKIPPQENRENNLKIRVFYWV